MAQAREFTVDQESFASFLKDYKPEEALEYERDKLVNRYVIQLDTPLPELSSPFAKAFSARDTLQPEQIIYALVYENSAPTRQKNIQALKLHRHPNMVALIAEGIVEISTLFENRYVVILEKPAGKTLAEIMAAGKRALSETFLIDFLLRPFVEILIAFNELGISHNSINLNTIYLSGTHFVLGECVSQPAGFSQPPLFDPIDRMLSAPQGKSDFAISADYYSLAMVALNLALGFQPFMKLSREQMVHDVLTKGSYHAFAILWDFPDGLQDFFRGLLNDAHRERWDPKIIESWLAGKRFNLILPSLLQETSRGFEFAGETYFNRKYLAQSIFEHGQEARIFLFDTKMIRWVESNLHKPELGEILTRIAQQSPGDTARADLQNSDLLTRMAIVLDPLGPIRFKNISTMVEGIEMYFSHAFIAGASEELQSLLHLLGSDVPAFWVEQQKNAIDYQGCIARLQKAREFMGIKSLGFGLERCLYYFFPNLPCMSPLVKKYHVTGVKELLLALNMVASQKTMSEHFMDRHIAAFIAAKTEMISELRISSLDGIPGIASHPKFIALKFLLRAQQKAPNLPPLPGLTAWATAQLFPLLDMLHKHNLKKTLQKSLKDISAQGSLQKIADLLLDHGAFGADYKEFMHISAAYAARQKDIEALKNQHLIERHAQVAARGMAQILAHGVWLLTVYLTLRSYIHF